VFVGCLRLSVVVAATGAGTEQQQQQQQLLFQTIAANVYEEDQELLTF
jgi:hypothetical protein